MRTYSVGVTKLYNNIMRICLHNINHHVYIKWDYDGPMNYDKLHVYEPFINGRLYER